MIISQLHDQRVVLVNQVILFVIVIIMFPFVNLKKRLLLS